MSGLLAGRLGVVTGGGSGIGRAICRRLAENGAQLVVVDRDEKSAHETAAQLAGGEHRAIAADVSSVIEVEKLRHASMSHLGSSPHILVNCAGITRDVTLLKMNESQFDEVIAVNLKSVYMVTQAFAQEAVASNTKLSVVNVSSVIGKVGSFGQTNYAASKAGVIAFSKSAAKELAKKGIRVNTVLPGFIETAMTKAMPDKALDSFCAAIPLGRMGLPGEVADGVLFLSSDLSSYITGAQIEITGGLFM